MSHIIDLFFEMFGRFCQILFSDFDFDVIFGEAVLFKNSVKFFQNIRMVEILCGEIDCDRDDGQPDSLPFRNFLANLV